MLVFVAVAILVLTACDNAGPSRSAARKDGSGDSLLLTADDLGSRAEGVKLEEKDTKAPTPCGPDDADLLGALDDTSSAAFRRGDQRIVVTAQRFENGPAELLSTMARKALDPTCVKGETTPPNVRWSVAPLQGLPAGSAGYSWTVTDRGSTTSGMRAYQQVGDYAVSATIAAPGSKAPDAGELRAILTRQAERVAQTPGVSDVNACDILDKDTVEALLGTAPEKTLELSHDGESGRHVLTCEYAAESARVTVTAQAHDSVNVARKRLADAKIGCASASAVDTQDFEIPQATGFLCSSRDGRTGYLEWNSIELRISAPATASDEDLLNALERAQKALPLDRFAD